MERYTLDLSRVFSDHRQKVFVGRRTSWKHIKCLLDHVRSIFEISANIYLTNGDNVLFPDFEVLDVILNTDMLRYAFVFIFLQQRFFLHLTVFPEYTARTVQAMFKTNACKII